MLVLAISLLAVVTFAASAIADQGGAEDAPVPTPADIAAAVESGPPGSVDQEMTDPSAAQGVPLTELGREEALELMTGVFSQQLEAPAGVYDNLQSAKLLSSNVAVVPDRTMEAGEGEETEESLEGSGASVEGGSESGAASEAAPEAEAKDVREEPPSAPAEVANADLVDSTVPLEVGDQNTSDPIDLSLTQAGGNLEPAEPLVEAKIPTDLGNGIELPGADVSISLAGAPAERTPTVTDNSIAFYPNVATDTDLAVSPTPSGVETLTQLRSLDSPITETYELSIPPNAELTSTAGGGAKVISGSGEVLMTVPPPSALDAAGKPIPVELEVAGDAVKVHVEPPPGASLPILVDPLFQTYEWAAKGTSKGICSNSFKEESSSSCNNREEWGYEVLEYPRGGLPHLKAGNNWGPAQPGIYVHAEGQQRSGDHATVLYTVPRYFKESPTPTSYIKNLKLSDVTWQALGQYASPYLFMGIWDATAPGWVSYFSHTGQVEHGINEPAFVYNFPNEIAGTHGEIDTHAKAAEVGIYDTEASASSNATVYVGAATVELGDKDAPSAPIPTTQTEWVNQAAPPLAFTASDTGLGVYAITAGTEELNSSGQPLHTWKALNGCVGVGDSACPRTWNSTEPGHPALTYEPALLPSGINYVSLVAEDPVGNKSASSWEEVRVDHIAPVISLAGSMTEQAALGTRRSSYTLKVTGSDGNAEHPQSGIARAEVKLDGKAVAMEGAQLAEWTPSCTSQNCPLSAEWTLSTAGLAEGKHTVEVIATDAAGVSTAPQTLVIESHAAPAPSVALSGSITEEETLGPSRPRYLLNVKSTATAAGFESPTLGATPLYVSSIGALGSENGKFLAPADVATDSKGDLWALDRSQGRIQEFNEKGEWLRNAGASGSGAGMLSTPSGVAVDTSGNVWVADTGNNRVVEFNEKGEFVQTFGTAVNKTKVEAAGTEAEKNLCTAASGNVCQVGTAGSGTGQMKAPQGIAVTSGGNIWIADTGNSRLEKFSASGGLINTVSGEGSEAGKLKEPSSITVAPDGSIWVADTGNNRIEQWNSSLSFVRAVGKEGVGGGEFKGPAAIEADSAGEIWVGDRGNNRIEEFDEYGAYLKQFGSYGTGGGQFSFSGKMGLTLDGSGNLWTTDGHFHVQRWTIPGFPVYLTTVGGLGTGNGKFFHPADIATDSKGNIWALDSEQARIQEFNEKGEWLRTAGSSGSGAGMLSSPSALAVDPSGNVWVADTGNNRVVEFNEKGDFVHTFGTAVNKTKSETTGATEAEKNLCTAASGNTCRAGTAGSALGQLSSPRGIATTAGGNLWVADTANNRIEKFTPSGGFLNKVASEGTEAGKLKEPLAITVAPDGSIWVADTGNNRIEQWNSSLSFVRAVGKEGVGGGEFKGPAAIEADASGDIWVADRSNNRVEEFAEGGKYLGEFGATGSGKIGFTSSPIGIAVDAGGAIWVTDPNHWKIQKWHQETPRSEVTTTIWFNGSQQTSVHGGCLTASCTIEPQWTLESPSYSPGTYPVRVKTTDGLGRSTESTLNVQVERDTTKPTLETGGELANAPEGWVEQETYGFNATATDGGFGLSSLALKIDGQQVASTSQSCADGGCNDTLSKQVSMASYSGGAHAAEVVATDGAGNSAVKKWTINVDPEGHISTEEANATLEAMETTASVNPVGQSEQERFFEGTTPGLGLEETGSTFTGSGGQVPLTVGSQPSAPMTMKILPANAFSPCEPEYFSSEEMAELSVTNLEPEEAEPGPSPECESPESAPPESAGTQGISVTPVSTATGAGSNTLFEGNAVVAANTATAVDTITRPLYEGALTFEAIRDETGPTSFTWEVHLEGGQELKLTDPRHATVYYAGGHPAFAIAAEPASDAVGTEVPTELEVSGGGLVTLLVNHRERNLVYPVLAGAGWQGGFTSVEIQGPKDEQELREERERIEQEEQELREAEEAGQISEASISTVGLEELVSIKVTGPPEAAPYSTDGPPLTGGVQQYTFKHHFKFHLCDYATSVAAPEAPPQESIDLIQAWAASKPTYCKKWIGEIPLNAGMNVKGWWKSNQVSQYTWIPKGDLECNKFGRDQPALVHCLKRPEEPAAEGKDVHVLGDFRFPPGNNFFEGGPITASPPACVTVRGRLANGPESHSEEPIITPSKVGDKCNWP